ncbi:hypothetical protein LZ32DRAFT_242768 [Colletotrichum eremochloae]|nr:hypothetical protein LZ32DRAFT_242768 [Colletotrichum eremochloae]
MKAVLFLIFFLWFFCYPFSVSKGRFSACSCFSFSLFSETRRNWAVEGKAWKGEQLDLFSIYLYYLVGEFLSMPASYSLV